MRISFKKRCATAFDHLWRLGTTGFCFASFAVGAAVLGLVVFPLLRLWPGSLTQRRNRAQRMVQCAFALFIAEMRYVAGLGLDVQGAERLRQCAGMLILANHPTLIDVIILLSLMPRADCVVKASLWRTWHIGAVLRDTAYIPNASPAELVDHCVAALDSGSPLLLFPEGTRTEPGQPLKFHKGAAYIAVRTGREMLPVVITCHPLTLTRGCRWYDIPSRPPRFTVQVGQPVRAADWIDATAPAPVAARRLTACLEEYFTREITALDASA